MTFKPKTIFELINHDNFRQRTAMFIGHKRINLLRAYIDGYFYAKWAGDIADVEDEEFSKFHDFTAEYFGWRESTAGWHNIILDECQGDEEKAVDKFFEVYDKFIQNKADT